MVTWDLVRWCLGGRVVSGRLFYWGLRGFLLIVLCGLGGITYSQREIFLLNKVEIRLMEGERDSFWPSIEHQLNLRAEQDIGKFLWDLDLLRLQSELQLSSWVQRVFVQRVWPSGLQIQVWPKRAFAQWHNGFGDFSLVSEEGTWLSSIDVVAQVPILVGDKFKQDSALRSRAVELLKALPSSGEFSFENIAEVGFERGSGLWVSLMKPPLRIKMGENEFDLKSQRVTRVLEHLRETGIEARVIDANLSQKVLVRMRKAP